MPLQSVFRYRSCKAESTPFDSELHPPLLFVKSTIIFNFCNFAFHSEYCLFAFHLQLNKYPEARTVWTNLSRTSSGIKVYLQYSLEYRYFNTRPCWIFLLPTGQATFSILQSYIPDEDDREELRSRCWKQMWLWKLL